MADGPEISTNIFNHEPVAWGMAMLSFLGLLLVGVVIVVFLFIKQYNELQQMSVNVNESHSNALITLKKKASLANKLLEIASEYGVHEKLTHISTANVEAMVHDHPDLKANQTFQQLMSQLHNIENDLQIKREAYNSSVSKYNAKRLSIPTNLYASKLGFGEAPFFDVENADSLENLMKFKTDDGELIITAMRKSGDKLLKMAQRTSEQLSTSGKQLIERKTKKASVDDAES